MASLAITRQEVSPLGFEKIDAILAFREPAVIQRFALDQHVSYEEADAVFLGLMQFFVASSFMSGYKTPSMAIDDMWHTFVLHMREYERFCFEIMNGTVYHSPGTDDSAFAFYPATRAVAAELCGELNESVWPSEHAPHPEARCISCDFTPEARFAALMH
jgi:hypothetical protein